MIKIGSEYILSNQNLDRERKRECTYLNENDPATRRRKISKQLLVCCEFKCATAQALTDVYAHNDFFIAIPASPTKTVEIVNKIQARDQGSLHLDLGRHPLHLGVRDGLVDQVRLHTHVAPCHDDLNQQTIIGLFELVNKPDYQRWTLIKMLW